MIEDEVQRVMSNPDHVIMSDDLALVLADVEEAAGEYLSLDENTFVCELQQAKRHTRTSWEFELVVHGLSFGDFVSFERAVFQYGDMQFLLTDQFEFISETKTISSRAIRIFN